MRFIKSAASSDHPHGQIPEREKVLARLVAALKPGGWIIEEEFDSQSLHCDPLLMSGEVHLKAQTALFRLPDERGVESRWGRLVYGRMRALGLVDVRSEARLSMRHAGFAGTSLTRANFEQLSDALIAGGYVTKEELEQGIARLDNPDFITPWPIMWTTSAGLSGHAPIGSVTEEEFDGIFDLNVRGTLFTVQKALPLFRDGGSIVLNGSIANQKGMPGLGVYGGSKAALRAFARSWLMDLKERRIRVNVLSPGPIDTPAMQKAPEAAREQFRSIIPWGEFGTSEEIATAALFLACDDSKFVNGTELCVDGGTAQI